MLKLKVQWFGHLMWRTDLLERTLMLGKIEGGRRRGWQRMRWFDGITDLTDMSLSKLRELVIDWEACHSAVHGFPKSQTWLSNWTELCNINFLLYLSIFLFFSSPYFLFNVLLDWLYLREICWSWWTLSKSQRLDEESQGEQKWTSWGSPYRATDCWTKAVTGKDGVERNIPEFVLVVSYWFWKGESNRVKMTLRLAAGESAAVGDVPSDWDWPWEERSLFLACNGEGGCQWLSPSFLV